MKNVKPVDKGQVWIRNITILAVIWGVLNLLFSSIVFGVIFILLAVLIRVFRSFMAIYVLGIVLWILALIQFLSATGFIHTGFTEGAAQGTELILIAIANFAVGVFIIYKTMKVK